MEKPGFRIDVSDGDVSQSYRGSYRDVADHKCVISIQKPVPTSTGTRGRCIGDVAKSLVSISAQATGTCPSDRIGDTDGTLTMTGT